MNPNMVWEYKILMLETYGEAEKKMPEWEAILNTWGQAGWELVSIDQKEGAAVFAYFKRALDQKP